MVPQPQMLCGNKHHKQQKKHGKVPKMRYGNLHKVQWCGPSKAVVRLGDPEHLQGSRECTHAHNSRPVISRNAGSAGPWWRRLPGVTI